MTTGLYVTCRVVASSTYQISSPQLRSLLGIWRVRGCRRLTAAAALRSLPAELHSCWSLRFLSLAWNPAIRPLSNCRHRAHTGGSRASARAAQVSGHCSTHGRRDWLPWPCAAGQQCQRGASGSVDVAAGSTACGWDCVSQCNSPAVSIPRWVGLVG